MAGFEDDAFSGPLFAFSGEPVFEDGCLQMQDCDPVGSMHFVQHESTKGLGGEVCPAILVCHGLRNATGRERELLKLVDRDNERVCDLEARFIRPDQAF